MDCSRSSVVGQWALGRLAVGNGSAVVGGPVESRAVSLKLVRTHSGVAEPRAFWPRAVLRVPRAGPPRIMGQDLMREASLEFWYPPGPGVANPSSTACSPAGTPKSNAVGDMPDLAAANIKLTGLRPFGDRSPPGLAVISDLA